MYPEEVGAVERDESDDDVAGERDGPEGGQLAPPAGRFERIGGLDGAAGGGGVAAQRAVRSQTARRTPARPATTPAASARFITTK